MFELVPYILTLNSEAEIMLIEDLEPGPDGLPKMSKVFPTMMVSIISEKGKSSRQELKTVIFRET